MGIFGQSSSFEADVEKATSETNTNENWSLILDVCDKVSSNPRNAKDCLKAIMKRMGHNDPHVVMQAITLLDACVSNCGKPFHLEIASRDFENEFRRLLPKAQPQVSLKMRQVLKNWSENEFKNDPELDLIRSLILRLRIDGFDFSNLNDNPKKKGQKSSVSKDPNVVSSQQEEDDIAKAIELSLKEAKSSPRHQGSSNIANNSSSTASGGSAYPSLYPSFSTGTGGSAAGSVNSSPAAGGNAQQPQPEPRKVRALYDFEAAEENELTFVAGEIIHVVDDSDPNWWKGYNQRGDGLFPSNFVSADLSVDPKRLDINQQTASYEADEAADLQQKTEDAAAAMANQRIEIDEAKIDRLLHLLHEANPEDPTQDSEEMLRLEQEVHQMGPLIDAELERVDRKHAQLTQLSSDLVDAINLYHSLMRDDRAAVLGASGTFMHGMQSGMQMPPAGGGMAPASLGYQGPLPNPQLLYGAAGFVGSGGGSFPQQMPPQSYGMSSLPYAAAGLPATTLPTVHNTPMTAGAAATTATVGLATQYAGAQQNTQIPLQFQNGHVNPTQLNGVGAIPAHQHMNATIPTSQQQPTLAGALGYHMQQQQQPYPQTSLQQPTMPMGNEAQQQQQQQSTAPPPHQQYMSPQHQTQQQQHLNYLPHQQQQPQQQFASIPNGQHSQQLAYMPTSATTTDGTTAAAGGMLQQLPTQQQQQPSVNNHTSMDQYNQLQQQMAAMSLGVAGGMGVGANVGFNQPVMQNFLTQNDTKQNIPIYQQQR